MWASLVLVFAAFACHALALLPGGAFSSAPSAVRPARLSAFGASAQLARRRRAHGSEGFRVASSRERELEGLKLDESKLDDEERQRLESLRNIKSSLAEVDAIQRELGLGSDDDDEVEEQEIAVVETDWSGQAGMDVTVEGQRDWRDLLSRRGLAVGDIAALTLFAWVGRATHTSTTFDFEVLKTAAPFVVGWLAASPLLGAYTNTATATQGEMAKTLVPAWAVSMPLALAIRAALRGEAPPVPFVVVSLVATLLALGAWRLTYVAVNPTSTAEYKRGGILDGFRMITTLLRRW